MSLFRRRARFVIALLVALAGAGCHALRPWLGGRLTAAPVVEVAITAPGRGAMSLEHLAAQPLEAALGGVPGVRAVRSVVTADAAVVRATFVPSVDPFAAAQAVMAAARGVTLPPDLPPPIVTRRAAAGSVQRYRLDGPGQDLATLRALHDEVVARRLETVSGVAAVEVCGGRRRQVEVRLDSARLAAAGLTLEAVAAALQATDRGLPAGRELVVRGSGGFGSVAEVAAAVAGSANGVPVRVRDLATVAVVARAPDCLALDTSGETVVGGVVPQAGVEPPPAALASAFGAAAGALPPGVTLRRLASPPVGETARLTLAVAPGTPPEARRALAQGTLGALGSLAEVAEALAEVRQAGAGGAFEAGLALDSSAAPIDVWVILRPERSWARGRTIAAVARDLVAAVPAATPARLTWGSPSRRPPRVALVLTGPDLAVLDAAARDARAALVALPGAGAVSVIGSGTAPTVDLDIDRAAAARLGVSPSAVAQAVAAAVRGVPAGTLRGADRLDVVVALGHAAAAPGAPGAAAPDAPGSVPPVSVPGKSGSVPLAQLVRVRLATPRAVILREGGARAVVLEVDVVAGSAARLQRAAAPAIAALRLPPGHRAAWRPAE